MSGEWGWGPLSAERGKWGWGPTRRAREKYKNENRAKLMPRAAVLTAPAF
jgi:hypothetical protein